MNSKIGFKDIYYNELWHGRDFEISHLWQRSVLLASLTVVSLSGLGVIVGDYAECIREGISIPVVINLSCCALCLFCLLLAELWVFMAKGSKEWFEKYESAICKVVEGIHIKLLMRKLFLMI